MGQAPIRILAVCTGNICRSPVAERVLQAGLDQVHAGAFEVRSAGTRALAGEPIQPASARIIVNHGGQPEPFAARQLTGGLLAGADLVLTMAAAHRSEVLALDPSLLKRTFTIREFARMLAQLELRQGLPEAGSVPASAARAPGLAAGPEMWRRLPADAASVRHLALAAEPAENDVVDPYRREQDAYDTMERQLSPAIDSILRYARLTWRS